MDVNVFFCNELTQFVSVYYTHIYIKTKLIYVYIDSFERWNFLEVDPEKTGYLKDVQKMFLRR